jgi:hypothetical protein
MSMSFDGGMAQHWDTQQARSFAHALSTDIGIPMNEFMQSFGRDTEIESQVKKPKAYPLLV